MLRYYFLDVIAAYFLPAIYGWIFLAFVFITEGFILARRLNSEKSSKRYYVSAIASNLITTLIGHLSTLR